MFYMILIAFFYIKNRAGLRSIMIALLLNDTYALRVRFIKRLSELFDSFSVFGSFSQQLLNWFIQ